MRLLTAVALFIFCTIILVCWSDLFSVYESALPPIRLPNPALSPVRLWMIDLQKLLPPAAATVAQTIPASEAAGHIGERTTVCGQIADERTTTRSRGKLTFIHFERPDPERVFTVRVWEKDRASAGAIPLSGMLCATGVITSYRGTPEIAVKDAKSWYVPK